jgi:hypothetical protein
LWKRGAVLELKQSVVLKVVQSELERDWAIQPMRSHTMGHMYVNADGFYEWQKVGSKQRQPYNFGMADDSMFALAGLWERWRDPDDTVVESFTILTTQPNCLVAEVHDRVPVILAPDYYDSTLDKRERPAIRSGRCFVGSYSSDLNVRIESIY